MKVLFFRIGLVGFIIVSVVSIFNAALTFSGTNVLTDGSMEYLTMAESGHMTRAVMEAKLAV